MEKGKLLDFLKPIFWEYDFDELSLEKDKELILSKILRDGDFKAIKWLYKTMGEGAIKEWILKTRGRGLSTRQLGFWAIVLSIPPSLIRSWNRSLPREIWDNR